MKGKQVKSESTLIKHPCIGKGLFNREWVDDQNRRHKEDGPAYISAKEDYKEWTIHGKTHREDGPAVIGCSDYGDPNRRPEETYHGWYLNGKKHRVGGPCSYSVGRVGNPDHWVNEEWRVHGKYHRTDGPAYICGESGRQVWYLNGKKHREGGPAVIARNKKEWWRHGKIYQMEVGKKVWVLKETA